MDDESLLADDDRLPGGIEVCPDPEVGLVRMWGDVDASLRDQASAAMVELLQRGGPFVVDVADVSFIDSSGIAFILQLHRVASDEGSRVVLRDPPVLVMDMLELIGLAGTIGLEFSPGDSARPSLEQCAEEGAVLAGAARVVDGDELDLTSTPA